MSVQELLHAMGSGFGRMNPLAVVIAGFLLIGAMGWLVFLEILRSARHHKEEVQIGWRYFEECATQKELSATENSLLKAVVRSGEVMSADMVFDSPYVFEDAVEAFLAEEKDRLARDPALYGVLRSIRFKLGFLQLPAEIPLSSTRQLGDGLAVAWTMSGTALKGQIQFVSEREWHVAAFDRLPENIRAGVELALALTRPGDAEYGIRTTLVAVRPAHRILVLAHTRNLERKQLRNWVRVEVNLPCRILVVSGPEHPGPDDRLLPAGLLVEGRLADLSGGGACARLPTSVPKGHKLSLNFDLPGGATFRELRAEVMRVAAVSKPGREDFEHHLKFMGLETAQQESIVRYVFEKQRLGAQDRGAPFPA